MQGSRPTYCARNDLLMRFQRKPHQFGCLLPWSDHCKSSSFRRYKKDYFLPLVYFSLCWAIICENGKAKPLSPLPWPSHPATLGLSVGRRRWRLAWFITQCVLSHALCWPCWKSLSNTCIAHVGLTCRKLETRVLVLLILYVCVQKAVSKIPTIVVWPE